MLTNKYIEYVMQFIPGFQGVFSSDTIPLLIKNKSSLIINFDKREDPGSHFIAVFKLDENNCYYFDSLKLGILPASVGEYLYQYNFIFDLSKEIQSYESTYCGFYCMLFIICQNISLNYWEKNCKKIW